MIVSNISHGFGNQLFQYAAGFAAARRAGAAFRIDTRYFRRAVDRTFQLDRLKISAPRLSFAQEMRVRLSCERGRPGLLGRVGRAASPLLLNVIQERGVEFDSAVLRTPDGTVLLGFWQSERYFADSAAALRGEFEFAAPPNDYNRALLARMQAGPSVSVHVRRGDYTTALTALSPLPVGYYTAALAEMDRRVPEATYFIFSDDPDWTRANIPVPAGSVYVTGNVGVSDTDDLRLMSHCSHFITANSSFSWWGAWLGRLPGKHVLSPHPWFNPGQGDEAHITPGDWTRVTATIV